MKTRTLLLTLALAAAFQTLSAGAPEIIESVRTELAPDRRQAVYEVELAAYGVLRGVTSEQSLHDATVQRLRAAGVRFTDSLHVYPADRMGLVRIPVASLRTAGRHAAEMATQALMGTPVRLLEGDGDWWRVQVPDGYIAWVPESSVVEKSPAEFDAWRRNSRRAVVGTYWTVQAFATPQTSSPREVVTDLTPGAIVEVDPATAPADGRTHIILPDGRTAWIDSTALTPIDQWAAQAVDAQKILDAAYALEGTSYLWGGMSAKAIDCSGLVKASYFANGLILRRDASQQALTGQRLEADKWPEYEAGDLLFFGSAKTGRITHVGIYDHDGRYVHSSGRVKRNSLDPQSPDYLYSPLHAARIIGHEGTEGITRARDHGWYFDTTHK